MATPMSDDELRSKLTELGEDTGPITDSTRILWRKKLDRLLADRKSQRRKVETNSLPVLPSLTQYSSDDSEADVKKKATLDRPTLRARRRTSNRFCGDSSSISTDKTTNSSADGDFKKPTGTSKSWRSAKQGLFSSPGPQAQASLPSLARPSLRSLTDAGRSNGVVPEFESSDSDVDEPSSRRSTRSTKRQSCRSTPGLDDSIATSIASSSGSRTRASKKKESSESSEVNDSSSLWEGNSATPLNSEKDSDHAKTPTPPSPEKGKRGRKRKAPAKSNSGPRKSNISQSASKKRCLESGDSRDTSVQPSKPKVTGDKPDGSPEPTQYGGLMLEDNSEDEKHMKNLQFIQLQMELAQAEHALKIEMIQKEHDFKMKQLQLMMSEYRERLSLPFSP